MPNSFVTPRSVAHQASLSMGLPRQEYWSRLPFPSPRELPDPQIRPESPPLAYKFFTTEPQGSLKVCLHMCSQSLQSCQTPSAYTLEPASLLSLWHSPGRNNGVDCHALLQGIFPTQVSNLYLTHCRWILYPLSHLKICLVLYKFPDCLSKWLSHYAFPSTMNMSSLFSTFVTQHLVFQILAILVGV